MKNIDNIIVNKSSLILDVLKILNTTSMQVVLVLDENKKLLGTISDGDIRRALLDGKALDSSIQDIYFTHPTVANVNDTKEKILNLCTSKKIHQIPIVDNNNIVIGLESIDELIKKSAKPNKVVLMVGGLGTRLKPLTNTTPKPMLHVGGKPILQTIVETFASYGYSNIIMCVNYKSNIIQDYFGDGHVFGVNIEYILENKRMGTAGALSLLKKLPNESFFVMNGDILTNVNFEHLHKAHINASTSATMCTREYDIQVPYGVVNCVDNRINSIVEKPIHKFSVSAGIYMLEPACIKLIPKDDFYDMPTLFDELISKGNGILPFPIDEYWLDIGRIEEYERANKEYLEVF
ncbi:D-glycero-D-manno-heptose 1-phosphate guanosyltransferase [hydrothermal vent metagenome]|uniref:D-glycero-D-manno-heptose 1-phosphate guanosyltransferase n=1 Tax=hydrothermal vent metagenome TaxID=652676 RepID=A0A1W1BBH1_9ZZZZ